MTRGLARVAMWLALALTAVVLTHPDAASADDPFVAQGHNPTQGTPVPGAYLTADLGIWSKAPDPETYTFQWLRDGAPVPGAVDRDYLIQVSDIGHTLAPYVTNTVESQTAHFTGDAMTVRKIRATLTLEVGRVHPVPGRGRLVWMASSFMSTERPWGTDGGTVAAYKKKDGRLKELGRAVVTRGAGFVRLPWKRAPFGRTSVMVCFLGSDVVEESCSPYAVVRRGA